MFDGNVKEMIQMSKQAPKINPIQIVGMRRDDIPGHENLVFQLGPRYSRGPLDDTTIMSIFHRTTNGNVSILLEREEFSAMAQALNAPDGAWVHPNSQTSAKISWTLSGSAQIEIWWNGSRRERSMFLADDQFTAFRRTIDDMDARGWEGWKSSGAVVGPTRH